jgi:hypothetical protein
VTILSESSTEHQEAGPLHLGQVLDDAQISTGAAPLLFRDSSGGSESRLRYTVTVTYEDLGSRHYTTVIEFDDPSGGQHPHPQAPADWPIDIARTSVRLA